MSGKLNQTFLIAFIMLLASGLAVTFGTMTNQEKKIEAQAVILETLAPPVTITETGEARIQDGYLLIRFRARRDRACPFEVFTEWKSGEGLIQPQANPNKAVLLPGEEAWLEIPTNIPPSLPRGAYEVRSVGVYDCDGRIHRVATDPRPVTYR